VGVRINTENGDVPGGDCDISIASIRFDPKGTPPFLFDFKPGLKDWRIATNGKVGIGKDQSARQDLVLHLVANPKQSIHLDHAYFPVKAGNAFEMVVSASVPQKSAGSGYFDVIFSGTKEIARKTIPFEGGMHLDEESESNEDGVFQFKRSLAPGNLIRITGVGDADHWPVSYETTLGANKDAAGASPGH
jgi:hypothetical protein